MECFDAAVKFARTEGIVPAPEPTHAIAALLSSPLNMDTMQFEEDAQARFYEIRGNGPYTLLERDEEELISKSSLSHCIDKTELIATLTALSKN